ncbi:MAG: S8 family serine peptidase, partial [Planctomycetota bacterium]|nr:S8 family serine peptidase [Planctomycetota bacterium]
GIDDDHNGFIDDVHGCNVVGAPSSHSGDPMDLNGHGTHAAGIVAATARNHLGGVGVAFNVQIMPIRAAQYSGALTVDDIAEGILYAADNGADVINMSFGGYQRSQLVEDTLGVAFNSAVLVAAAGNGGAAADTQPFYPAALPWVLGVMSCDQGGKLSWFTNYDNMPGTKYEYEVAAPGESIYSTLPGNKYAAWSGTSMAAPVVSGVAALLRSYYFDRNSFSNRFIMGQISGTCNGRAGNEPGQQARVVDVNNATTQSPPPGVTMQDKWLFDSPTILPANDGDGRVDSGETLHLGVVLFNGFGKAKNVTATLRARVEGAGSDDPYVAFAQGTLGFPDIGSFLTVDNGLVRRDSDGVDRYVPQWSQRGRHRCLPAHRSVRVCRPTRPEPADRDQPEHGTDVYGSLDRRRAGSHRAGCDADDRAWHSGPVGRRQQRPVQSRPADRQHHCSRHASGRRNAGATCQPLPVLHGRRTRNQHHRGWRYGGHAVCEDPQPQS